MFQGQTAACCKGGKREILWLDVGLVREAGLIYTEELQNQEEEASAA